MTEEAFFSSAARKDCFNDLGVKQYEILAALDSHTSDLCRSLDGHVYPMKAYEPGVTALPFHVFCRSTTIAHFEDNFGEIGERTARDEAAGKIYYVPADMTYLQWQKAFVNGGDKSGLHEWKENETAHWTREDKADKIKAMNDITQEWMKTNKKGSVVENLSYIANAVNYIVGGKHVVLRPSDHEREIAAILSEQYGKTVEFVPQIMCPQGIQTPDYLIDGESFDLKSPTGKSKNLFYNVISKKMKQASSFIFEVTNCPLSEEEIKKQVEALYFSRHTRFVNKIVIMKDGKILKVYERK